MSAKTEHKAFSVGLFSIIGIALLIFTYLWVNNFRLKPNYSFYVSFLEPKQISAGTEVIFRGVVVGKVSEIKFSEDFLKTIIKLDITQKGLRLPKDVNVLITESSLIGQKIVSIMLPNHYSFRNALTTNKLTSNNIQTKLDNENSLPELIENGDLITGIDSPGFIEMQLFANRILRSMDKMLSGDQGEETLDNVNQTFDGIDVLVQQYNCLAQRLDYIFEQNKPALKMLFGNPSENFKCE